jgi:hypothetical protein
MFRENPGRPRLDARSPGQVHTLSADLILHADEDAEVRIAGGALRARRLVRATHRSNPFLSATNFGVRHAQLAGHILPVVKDYPNVLAFQRRCIGRPAWKKTFDAYCDRVEAA